MGKFLTGAHAPIDPTGCKKRGRLQYRLLQDVGYQIGCEHSEDVVWARRGMITDLASVPRFFFRVLTPAEMQWAAVIHDHLYRYHEYDRGARTAPCSRRMSDWIFRQALADQPGDAGIGFVRRWLAWLAVRMFGGPFYEECDE